MNPIAYNPLPTSAAPTTEAALFKRSPLYDSLFNRPQTEVTLSGPDNHNAEPHVHGNEEEKADVFNSLFSATEKADKARRITKHGSAAVGLFAAGLILHNTKLPARTSSFKLLSTDWKEWTKIGLGVAAAGQINKALNWSPPPWLGAVMAVALINPLVLGFKKGLPQFAIMGPLVAGVVQGASWLNKKFGSVLKPKLEEKLDRKIPDWVPKVAISAAMITVGLLAYPRLFKAVATTGLLGAEAKAAAASGSRAMLGTSGAVCVRGCCPSVICLSEIGEMVGGMRTGHQNNATNTATGQPQFGHDTRTEDSTATEHSSLIKLVLMSPVRVLQWFGEFFGNFFKDMGQLVRGSEEHSSHAGHDHDDHEHDHEHKH